MYSTCHPLEDHFRNGPMPREEIICFGEFTLVFAIDVIFSSVLGESDAEAMSAFDLAAALSVARALSAAARAAWDTMVRFISCSVV